MFETRETGNYLSFSSGESQTGRSNMRDVTAVKTKKAHTIEETSVKLYLLNATNIVLCAKTRRVIRNSLSDNTGNRRIDELAKDMRTQVLGRK
jgi:hypothetical protein